MQTPSIHSSSIFSSVALPFVPRSDDMLKAQETPLTDLCSRA